MLKRAHVLLAGAASLLAPLQPVQAGDTPPDEPAFTPPSGPIVLTRTVWRELHDGQAIRVSRSYAVTIRPTGTGYVVDGEPIDTAVEAPAAVAMLAELERKRIETGLFPIQLDRSGRILSRSAPQPAAPAHGETRATGETLLAAAALAPQVRQQASGVLGQVIGAARTGTAWPTDLFNPAAAERQQIREVQLPGGAKGQVAVAISVERREPGQVPRSFERTVTTSLGGTDSITLEQWTMGPR